MADTLGNIFSTKNLPAIASGTSLGLGEIGNLIVGSEASSQQKQLQNQENAISSLTPAALSAKVNSAAQPISNAMIQQIGNTVQGDVASRGLAQAPGIFAAEESQALAPIAQQNYQTALQQVLAQLGLPLEYANTLAQFLPKTQNLSPAMGLFLQQLAKLKSTNAGNGGVTTGPNISQLSPPPDSGGTYGDTGTSSTDPFAGISALLGANS